MPDGATCTVDGCGSRSMCRGWCTRHYQRWRRNGDPCKLIERPTLEARFWSKVDKSGGPDACWPWTRSVNERGYGKFHYVQNGKPKRAHRVAYELAIGPIPDGLEVLHSCDNPPCCNPAHLRPGTHAHNMAEAVVRRRRRRKFTDEQLTEILYSQKPAKQLMEEYGISEGYLYTIKRDYVPGMHRSFTKLRQKAS